MRNTTLLALSATLLAAACGPQPVDPNQPEQLLEGNVVEELVEPPAEDELAPPQLEEDIEAPVLEDDILEDDILEDDILNEVDEDALDDDTVVELLGTLDFRFGSRELRTGNDYGSGCLTDVTFEFDGDTLTGEVVCFNYEESNVYRFSFDGELDDDGLLQGTTTFQYNQTIVDIPLLSGWNEDGDLELSFRDALYPNAIFRWHLAGDIVIEGW